MANLGYGGAASQVNNLGAYGANVGNTMMQTGELGGNALAKQGGARSSAYTGYGNALSSITDTLARQMDINRNP